MTRRPKIRACFQGAIHSALLMAAFLVCFGAHAQQSQTPIVLDRVVAVVNRQAILDSDIEDEIRASILDPVRTGQDELTRQHALELLISRTLIQQQIRREDLLNAEPTRDEVSARVQELRRMLPECVHEHCETDAGWKAFLERHHLTEERVDAYSSYRLEILAFIEQRFRSGIHISQQDIEDYYQKTLLPQYKSGESIPTLKEVAPRIEEILLQQQVNILFDEWLTNLHNQGDIEILDPSLEEPRTDAPAQSEPPVAPAKESR
jgi:peptidyl-prolyl cis-trans isomerase SurA